MLDEFYSLTEKLKNILKIEFTWFLGTLSQNYRRGVNRGMQIRRSVVFFGPIRRSDLIFVQIRIRVSLKNFSWYIESSVVA